MLSFYEPLVSKDNSCAFRSQWSNKLKKVKEEKKKKGRATDFSFVTTKGGLFPPPHMQRTCAEAASPSSSARQRQLGECSLVLQRLTSRGPNNFRHLIWCFHPTLATQRIEGPRIPLDLTSNIWGQSPPPNPHPLVSPPPPPTMVSGDTCGLKHPHPSPRTQIQSLDVCGAAWENFGC